ncbi:MAG: hypothetical protein WAV38_04815, partial [Xanthobacteraceae bacterium]
HKGLATDCLWRQLEPVAIGIRQGASNGTTRSSSDTYRKKGLTFSISVRLPTSGKSFTAGFGIGWTTDFEKTILLHRLFPGPFRSPRFGLHPVPKTPS